MLQLSYVRYLSNALRASIVSRMPHIHFFQYMRE
jgi:hypothetical protein